MILSMGRKNYSEEFRRQAVDLYESTPGATFRAIPTDLGVERNTLSQWVTLYVTGKKTTPAGDVVTDHRAVGPYRQTVPVGPETLEARIARLEVGVIEVLAGRTRLTCCCAAHSSSRRSCSGWTSSRTSWCVWDQYLAPVLARPPPVSADQAMYAVGVVEILAGLLVAFHPGLGSLIVAAWPGGIIVNLMLIPGFYDVAVRDFGLLLAAVALQRLATTYDAHAPLWPLHR